MDWTGCEYVERVPRVLGGAPVVRNSRVRADTLVDCVELGESAEEIAYNYDLDIEDVLSILSFAREQSLVRSA